MQRVCAVALGAERGPGGRGFPTMQRWKHWKVHGIQASLRFSTKRPLEPAPSLPGRFRPDVGRKE